MVWFHNATPRRANARLGQNVPRHQETVVPLVASMFQIFNSLVAYYDTEKSDGAIDLELRLVWLDTI